MPQIKQHEPSIKDVMLELKEIRNRMTRIETRMIKSFAALGVDVIHSREFVEVTRKNLRIEENRNGI